MRGVSFGVAICNLKRNQKISNLDQNKNFAIYKKLLCTFVRVNLLFEIFFFLLRKESNCSFGNGIEVGHIML